MAQEILSALTWLVNMYQADPQEDTYSAEVLASVFKQLVSKVNHYQIPPTLEVKVALDKFMQASDSFKKGDVSFLVHDLNVNWVRWLLHQPDTKASELLACLRQFWIGNSLMDELLAHPSTTDEAKLEIVKRIVHPTGVKWILTHPEIYTSKACLDHLLRHYPHPPTPLLVTSLPEMPWEEVFQIVPHALWPICFRAMLSQEYIEFTGFMERVVTSLLGKLSKSPGIAYLSASDLKDGLVSKNKDIRLASLAIVNQIWQAKNTPPKQSKSPKPSVS